MGTVQRLQSKTLEQKTREALYAARMAAGHLASELVSTSLLFLRAGYPWPVGPS
jgi:hypothetical protein